MMKCRLSLLLTLKNLESSHMENHSLYPAGTWMWAPQ